MAHTGGGEGGSGEGSGIGGIPSAHAIFFLVLFSFENLLVEANGKAIKETKGRQAARQPNTEDILLSSENERVRMKIKYINEFYVCPAGVRRVRGCGMVHNR